MLLGDSPNWKRADDSGSRTPPANGLQVSAPWVGYIIAEVRSASSNGYARRKQKYRLWLVSRGIALLQFSECTQGIGLKLLHSRVLTSV